MSGVAADTPARTIVVVGGGFSGSLFALKMARARPADRVVLLERERRFGRGVAYGACSPEHLLNVPVSRMELGLTPGFAEWLAAEGLAHRVKGDLKDGFAPRELFGAYMEAQVRAAASGDPARGLQLRRGEAVALLDAPRYGVRLWGGEEIAADLVVLAVGNLPPRPPGPLTAIAGDAALFEPDPWARDAFEGLDPDAPVLLVGAGLTTVDVVLRLAARGHRGRMTAVSRRGLLPQVHEGGGAWGPVLDGRRTHSPVQLMRHLRREAAEASRRGVPWQRVLDAARPGVAAVWDGWDQGARSRFLRHGRAWWDVHRHRMAPDVAERLQRLRDTGQLQLVAGRIAEVRRTPDGAEVRIARRRGAELTVRAARIVNCTGPRTDFDRLGTPLIGDLRRRGLMRSDPLQLGVESAGCALVDRDGRASARLFAIGPLTKPAWWEVVAVPEIAAQIETFVARLAAEEPPAVERPLAEVFNDLGAGI